MNLLPKASRTRPHVACEIAPGGIVAARTGEAAASVAAAATAPLSEGALAPGLKPGNVVDRLAVIAAVRKTLDAVGVRPNSRNADVTVVIPDGACRVLLLDFDALPGKLSEALPLVRFRLKKLVPFDADAAMISFQVMSQSKQVVRVLAVAIPRDVLAEYEGAVREAGFEPGAVLPSTLASVAGAPPAGASLIVNAAPLSVTTAIVRDGILLLHRTVDLQLEPAGVPANVAPGLLEPSALAEFVPLPIVSREETEAEWAAQEPLPEYGRDPYADRLRAEESVQNFDSITGLEEPATPEPAETIVIASHNVEPLPADAFAQEVAQAVSVAAAYFEDTLAAVPDAVLASGTLQPASLQTMLRASESPGIDSVRVRELVPAEALAAEAASSRVSRTRLGPAWGALCG